MYREGKLRKLKVSSLDLYVDKHGISCPRNTLKKVEVDIVAADIAKSLIGDKLENEEDDADDEESEEEYEDDAVLEEIGDNSDDKDEATDA